MPVPSGNISTSDVWIAPEEPAAEKIEEKVEETPEDSD